MDEVRHCDRVAKMPEVESATFLTKAPLSFGRAGLRRVSLADAERLVGCAELAGVEELSVGECSPGFVDGEGSDRPVDHAAVSAVDGRPERMPLSDGLLRDVSDLLLGL